MTTRTVVDHSFGFATQQVHAGGVAMTGVIPRATPIYLTAGFVFDDFDNARNRFAGDDPGYNGPETGN